MGVGGTGVIVGVGGPAVFVGVFGMRLGLGMEDCDTTCAVEGVLVTDTSGVEREVHEDKIKITSGRRITFKYLGIIDLL